MGYKPQFGNSFANTFSISAKGRQGMVTVTDKAGSGTDLPNSSKQCHISSRVWVLTRYGGELIRPLLHFRSRVPQKRVQINNRESKAASGNTLDSSDNTSEIN
jgi:hypothetical protein